MMKQYSGNYSKKNYKIDVMFYLAQNSPPKV